MSEISNPYHPEQITPEKIRLRNRLSGFIGRAATFGVDPTMRYAPAYSFGDLIDTNTFSVLTSGSEQTKAFEAAFLTSPRLNKDCFISGINTEDPQPSVVQIKCSPGQPLRLPTANFVAASGFAGWTKGRPDGRKGSDSSSAKIRQFARMSAKNAPPVGNVMAYLQPNGLVLYGVQDGAHRVGAAKARRDETIAVGGTIALVRLKEDVVQLEQDSQAIMSN